MKKVLLFLFSISIFIQLTAKENIKVEPPNWWVGMKHNTVQVLVYGDQVGLLDPKFNYEGVELVKAVKVENPNYLILYLNISDDALPGSFNIDFMRGKKTVHTYSYELRMREKGSADIQGFDTSDVLYLITPDRFANGDPSNDYVEGMKEKPNREFHGGRHGGDIKGMTDHLDYLADIGFTAIWINPIIENDMYDYSYHGYAATDFYKVDRRYGSNEEYKTFIAEAKSKGIKIIMDMIINHSGSEHWMVKDPPTKDWVNFENNYYQTSHRRNTVQDIHASEFDKKAFSDGWFVATMPDLNQRNELFADYLTMNTLWWIEYSGISGIRMDTYPYPDKDYMSDWTCAVMTEYPDFNIVGEEWVTNPAIVSYWQAGKINHDGYTSCLPSLMDFPIQNALTQALRNEESWGGGLIQAYETLALDFLYPDPYNLVIFPDNHDMDRFYTQINNDLDLWKMGIVYYSTMRGIPQFYYGTEVLMKNDGHPGHHGIIRTDFPGGWESDEVNAVTEAGLSEDQKEAKAFMKYLLNWRKKNKTVHKGKLIQFAPSHGMYAYFRIYDGKILMVVFNKNEEAVDMPMARFDEFLKDKKSAYDVINQKDVSWIETLNIPKKSALIFEIK